MKSTITVMALMATCLLSLSVPAFAEIVPVPMTGFHSGLVKGRANVAVPSYHINFITSHQATAVASIGARSRLAMVLVGPDEAVMRRLTEEAYADLRSQLTAAGLPVLPETDTPALTAGLEFIPGNIEKTGIGAGITIGKSNKFGWVTVAPEKAPALKALRNMTTPGGMALGMGGLALGKMNKPAGQLDATVIMPMLTLDFANTEASTGSDFLGRDKASVSGQVAFSILMSSPVAFQNPAGTNGIGTPGSMRPKSSVILGTKFATVEEGGAPVRVGSMTSIADENYQSVARARGDAVVVDMAAWEGLVRDAYKSYNAAIVENVLKGRK